VEAVPLLSLLNKPHLLNITQDRFILIQTVAFICVLHVSACSYAILTHVSTKILKGRDNKKSKGPLFTVAIFYNVKI